MSQKNAATEPGENESGMAGFISHLIELRNRLLKSVLAVFVLFVVLFPFANDLYSLLAGPLMAKLPEGTTMIATQVISPFFVPLKLAGFTALFIAIPYLLYQLWAFIAPGLYENERQLVLPLVVSSTLLFYLGAAFAYFAVFPVVFGFLASTTPDGVAMMTDINEYLSFVITLFFAFGLAFEVPVATVLLVMVGAVTTKQLAEKRRYAILIAFIIGAILTPPDILSQFMMAIPVWMLYELGIVIGHVIEKKRAAKEAAEEGEETAASGNAAHASAAATATAAATADATTAERTATASSKAGTKSDGLEDWDEEFDEAVAAQEALEKDAKQDNPDDDQPRDDKDDKPDVEQEDRQDESDTDKQNGDKRP